MSQDVAVLAARLARATADRAAVASLSEGVAGLDAAAGYAIHAVARAAAGPVAEWKLWAVSAAAQAQAGVGEPVHGFLAAAGALDLGEPLVTAQLIAPRAFATAVVHVPVLAISCLAEFPELPVVASALGVGLDPVGVE